MRKTPLACTPPSKQGRHPNGASSVAVAPLLAIALSAIVGHEGCSASDPEGSDASRTAGPRSGARGGGGSTPDDAPSTGGHQENGDAGDPLADGSGRPLEGGIGPITNLDGAAPLGDSASGPGGACGTAWSDRILNADCSLNWDEYAKVADGYDQTAVVDYRFGPKWSDLHPDDPQGKTLPKLWGAPDRGIQDSWYKYKTSASADSIWKNHGDWFSNAGQLLYSPDATTDHGVALARPFADYHEQMGGANYWHAFDLRVAWSPDGGDWFDINPDYSVKRKPVVDANGGEEPRLPVAVARASAQRGMIGIMVYQNGLVVAARNDPQVSQYNAVTRLPKGKVPTAVAITPASEFALITTWDATAKKGELFVVALQGRLTGTHDQWQNTLDVFGLPNWFYIVSMKVLGSVPLPFAAPTSVAAGVDQTAVFDARDGNNHVGKLADQSERDLFARTSDHLHSTPRAGYAIVASRAEGKVALVDMQPLHQFYRKMYFTTQSNYDQTKNIGASADQWPYTFTRTAEQTPVVASILDVAQPTAVAAGIPRAGQKWNGNDDTFFNRHAYVATMDGQFLGMDLGGLNTEQDATAPTITIRSSIGRNPTNITFGSYGFIGNQIWVTSRADRAIYRMAPDGTVVDKLVDQRMLDPVDAVASYGRGATGVLSVMDFDGKQALTYLQADVSAWPWASDVYFRVGNGKAPYEFTFATPIPGKPFQFRVCEVF